MQRKLLAAHPEWGPHDAESGKRQLLWLVGELGEVIDIVKKKKPEQYMKHGGERAHLVEEFADVLMYLIDALDCYGVTPDELGAAFMGKNSYNFIRDDWRTDNA